MVLCSGASFLQRMCFRKRTYDDVMWEVRGGEGRVTK